MFLRKKHSILLILRINSEINILKRFSQQIVNFHTIFSIINDKHIFFVAYYLLAEHCRQHYCHKHALNNVNVIIIFLMLSQDRRQGI